MTELDRACRRIRWENRLLFWVPVLAFLFLLAVKATAQSTALDIGALIEQQCGPPGFSPDAGCTIELPRGRFEVGPTVIGTCTTTTNRQGVTIVGQGSSGHTFTPRYPTAATTLVYSGPAGGTMFSICGSRNHFRDFAVDGTHAATVFEWRANNSKSAGSHMGGLERIDVDGGGTAIRIIGEEFNDQADFLKFEDLTLRAVDVCFDQDSQQAAANELYVIDCASKKAGFILRNGSAHFTQAYTGQWGTDPTYIGYHLTKSQGPPYMAHAATTIERAHMEITHGRFIVDDSASSYAVTLIHNTFQMISPVENAQMILVHSVSPGPLLMLGDQITGGAAPNPTGRICKRGGPLNSLGVSNTPWTKLVWGCL